MLFNSFEFIIFLPIVFVLFWILPSKNQWLIILIASCVFYMSWNPKYIILIAITVFVSFFCALFMDKYEKHRKLFLAVSLVTSLGLLVAFKYFGLLLDTIRNIFSDRSIPMISIVLPVGISFYTFQTIGYAIDVYKGRIRAEHNLGMYAAFITFFPQLVAGPIERTENLLPQIKKKHQFDYEKAKYGVKLLTWGYFKKLVIADNLAVHVDAVYNNLRECTGLALIIATVFFSFQIYCDFSGYSDIARGVAKLFDIDLMKNFDSPYLSTSLKEFWGRWHISLSTWFRDYVYIPLGGNRKGNKRKNINLCVTFLGSGLWHGANWTFAVWGLLHGILQIIENLLPKKKIKNDRWPFIILTFVAVSICWVFFRADTINDAFFVLGHSFEGVLNPYSYIYKGYHDLLLTKRQVVEYILILAILVLYDFRSLKGDIIQELSAKPSVIRWGTYYAALICIYSFGNFGNNQFVYFQF